MAGAEAWPQLRQRIRDGEVTALYSYSLSRLARSTRELLDVIEECDQAGVHVVLAKEGVVTGNSASGKLYLTVLGAVATFEAEVAAERVRDAHAVKRARGEVVWRLPYGQRIGADGKARARPRGHGRDPQGQGAAPGAGHAPRRGPRAEPPRHPEPQWQGLER